METFDSLPSRPLRRTEVRRLRATDSVDGLIELGSGRVYWNGGLHEAVALTGGRVIDLSFEEGTWKQTVLARDADQQRHVREALKQLPENR